MKNNVKKYGLMTIAAVLLVAMAFAGAASAEDIAPTGPQAATVIKANDDGTYSSGYPVSNAYLIGNEANWRYVTNHTELWDDNLVLTNDIVFTEPINSTGTELNKFNGTIYGNGFKFVNFTQSGTDAHGLIYYATDGCVLNNVHMYECNITSSSKEVGGLVGVASSVSGNGIQLCGCSVEFSNVTSSSYSVGGLVGGTDVMLWINASWIDHTFVNAPTRGGGFAVGGLIGYQYSPSSVYIKDSCVNCSEVNGGGDGVGGVFGWAGKTSSCLTNVSVKDSKIKTIFSQAGGLVGYAYQNVSSIWNGCVVENCTISSAGTAGGLVAKSESKSNVWNGCEVKNCTISSDGVTGGLVGIMNYNTVEYLNISDCTIADCTVTFKGSSTRGGAGLVGNVPTGSGVVVIYLNNVMENVTVKPRGTFGAGVAGLIEGSEVPSALQLNISLSSATDSIAPQKEIVIGNNVTVRNSSVLPYGGTTAKAEVVQADYQHVIDKITSVSVGDTITSIGANAFTGSSITSAVDLPNTASEGYVSWILCNSTHDAVSSLEPSKFIYAVVQKEAQEVTLNANGGTVNGKLFVNKSEVPDIAPLAEKAGYNFSGWYGETALTNMVFNDTGVVNKSVSGWTDENGKWIHEGASTLYANLTAVEYNITVSGNNVTFPANLSVGSVKFDTNSDVTAVAFKYEAPQGTPQKGGFTVDTIGDPFTLTPTGSLNGTKAVVNFNITSAQMESYNPENIRLAHYVGSAWTFVKPTYNGLIADNHTFSAEIDSMSPFAVVSYVEDPKPTYSPSSSKQTGSTVILSEGQVAPTAYATATPTVAPTVKPTEQPVTPTVIATAKPTAQSTQASPAPFFGIIAGLGVAAVLLRLRK